MLFVCLADLLSIVLKLFTHIMQAVALVKELTKSHILLHLRNLIFIFSHLTVIPKIIKRSRHLHIYV